MAAKSACSCAAPAVENRYWVSTLSQSTVETVASTALVTRRSGAAARARARKPSVVRRCVRSGSISAVGARLAAAAVEEPLSVAQGFLRWEKEKVSMVESC